VARIPETERFSSERLAHDLRHLGKAAQAFDDIDGLLEFLSKELRAGDVVLTMSNGSFDDVNSRLLASLKESGK
jgi:UDP-N-acetylmuramate-alanine ligase